MMDITEDYIYPDLEHTAGAIKSSESSRCYMKEYAFKARSASLESGLVRTRLEFDPKTESKRTFRTACAGTKKEPETPIKSTFPVAPAK